jgi:phosphoglycerate dehydrogenase-like enzyme
MTLVIWPPVPEHEVAAIREAAGAMEVLAPQSEGEAREAAARAEGWIGKLTPELLERAPRLRWNQSPTISLESVVFPDLAASDVVLTKMRDIQNDHISTHVTALFLGYCRELPRLLRLQMRRQWLDLEELNVHDPAEMTVLIMGLGGIGAEVARRLDPFGSTILGVDPKVTSAPAGVDELYTPDRLAELLPRADAVIICAPQTPETTGLFDEAMFQRMKPSAYFINIGRGKIVRLAALERALAEGWIAGAGVDVFEIEPLPKESPLWEMEQVVITPHSAGHGPHLEERRLRVVLENVRRFVAGEPLENVADKQRWY